MSEAYVGERTLLGLRSGRRIDNLLAVDLHVPSFFGLTRQFSIDLNLSIQAYPALQL